LGLFGVNRPMWYRRDPAYGLRWRTRVVPGGLVVRQTSLPWLKGLISRAPLSLDSLPELRAPSFYANIGANASSQFEKRVEANIVISGSRSNRTTLLQRKGFLSNHFPAVLDYFYRRKLGDWNKGAGLNLWK